MCKSNQVKCKGELNLAGAIIPCYVLEDGTRVLSGRKMQEALKIVDGTISGAQMGKFIAQKSLNPFIIKYLSPANSKAIICYNDDKKVYGYKAELMADICDAMLEARKTINLAPRQKIVADQCEILMRGFARVGITALVDEATGYQSIRESTELQRILAAYVSEETAKWQLTFSVDFYKEMFRLWGIDFDPKGRFKPLLVGALTNTYVYKELPEGVLPALKEKTGKTPGGYWNSKFHQHLTEDIGRKHLAKQIAAVTALMAVSETKEQFKELFERWKRNREQELREAI